MSRETVARTTITCDADFCHERLTILAGGLMPKGWTLDYRNGMGVDLCPRCTKGICAHAVGKDEYGDWCHCAEPAGHDGEAGTTARITATARAVGRVVVLGEQQPNRAMRSVKGSPNFSPSWTRSSARPIRLTSLKPSHCSSSSTPLGEPQPNRLKIATKGNQP